MVVFGCVCSILYLLLLQASLLSRSITVGLKTACAPVLPASQPRAKGGQTVHVTLHVSTALATDTVLLLSRYRPLKSMAL